MAITVNKKFWIEFIDIYRTLPCLWNSKDENYTSRQTRAKALEKLVKKMQEIEPSADQDSVKRKINTFRSNFNREIRKIRQTENKQSDGEYTPTLWYFDNLTFLLNQEKYSNNSKSMSAIEDTYDDDDIKILRPTPTKCEVLDDSDPLQTTPDSQEEETRHSENSQKMYNETCRSKQNIVTEVVNVMDYDPEGLLESVTRGSHNDNTASVQANNIELESTTNCRQLRSGFNKICRSRVRDQDPYTKSYKRDVLSIADEAALFGQTWACEFRKLNAQQKLFAKKAIDEILVLGQLNVLKLQTVPVDKTLTEIKYT